MRSLGKVIGKSASGYAILRPEQAPKPKASVFNLNRKKIGFVAGVIGPVSKPYVLVKSNSKEGQELFVGE